MNLLRERPRVFGRGLGIECIIGSIVGKVYITNVRWQTRLAGAIVGSRSRQLSNATGFILMRSAWPVMGTDLRLC